MASLGSRMFYALLRFVRKKRFLEMQFAFGKFDFYNSNEPPKETYRTCNIGTRQLNGRPVFILTPKTKKSQVHILYLHGGAFVQGFVRQHWKFLSTLVECTHCTVTAPDYPLAPQHTYLDAFDMVEPLYRDLIRREGPKRVILMGDSAGGGFALALAQKMKFDNITQPDKIILLSPWLDLALKNPEIEKIDPLDPFLGVSGLRKAGLAYAGESDLDNFMLSPINGPLEQLGAISIFVGSRDILVADARKLQRIALQKGIFINYREYEDMVHVWMFLDFQEARLAKEEIIKLITEQPDKAGMT